ncbi:hypothetical protein NKR23_g7215 [Pleurostoma richardsiae]|uniref:Cytochrome b561 domain-containing protein n=1 Tax=Pleurostoma richardsiae TaxID=41990 RepID=A0AA38RAQ0_9PEZI|nr:hypothetical protein NKR23_g7215 [Pleurostoma richardsiae]
MTAFTAIFWLSLAASVGFVRAWGLGGWYGNGGSDSDGDGYSGYGSGSSDDSSSSGAFGGFAGADFNVETASHYRNVHGILAAIAFVIIFPLGAVFMRLIPGRFAVWIHAMTQFAGYALFIAAAALGFWLVREVKIPPDNSSLLSSSQTNYHPIIGILVLVALIFQPLLGFIHHLKFKRVQRRQIWSHLHIWNGRIMVPLGIINGGLGLKLASASSDLKTAYAVVAGIMGGLWLLTAVVSELRRSRNRKEPGQITDDHIRLRRRDSRRRYDRTEKVLHRSDSGHSTSTRSSVRS